MPGLDFLTNVAKNLRSFRGYGGDRGDRGGARRFAPRAGSNLPLTSMGGVSAGRSVGGSDKWSMDESRFAFTYFKEAYNKETSPARKMVLAENMKSYVSYLPPAAMSAFKSILIGSPVDPQAEKSRMFDQRYPKPRKPFFEQNEAPWEEGLAQAWGEFFVEDAEWKYKKSLFMKEPGAKDNKPPVFHPTPKDGVYAYRDPATGEIRLTQLTYQTKEGDEVKFGLANGVIGTVKNAIDNGVPLDLILRRGVAPSSGWEKGRILDVNGEQRVVTKGTNLLTGREELSMETIGRKGGATKPAQLPEEAIKVFTYANSDIRGSDLKGYARYEPTFRMMDEILEMEAKTPKQKESKGIILSRLQKTFLSNFAGVIPVLTSPESKRSFKDWSLTGWKAFWWGPGYETIYNMEGGPWIRLRVNREVTIKLNNKDQKFWWSDDERVAYTIWGQPFEATRGMNPDTGIRLTTKGK